MTKKPKTKKDKGERVRRWKHDNKARLQLYQRGAYRKRRLVVLRERLTVAKAFLKETRTTVGRMRLRFNIEEIEIKIGQLEHDQKTDH